MGSTVARMRRMWRCMFSPRLYKIYFDGRQEDPYRPVGVEKIGERTLATAYTAIRIGYYATPLICLYIIQRGFLSMEEVKTLMRFFGGIGCIATVFFVMRAYGRSYSPKYLKFIDTLDSPMDDKNAYLKAIRKYDFDFSAWPVTFTADPEERQESWLQNHPFAKCANMDLPVYQRVIIQILAFIAAHTFGIRLIYPGSLFLIHNLLWSGLLSGRTQLVEYYNGERAKICTSDGNHIETMFVESRHKSFKGRTLIICCEGNSGYYEIGVMTTPVKGGFSVLGWNHPGFGGSTGTPFPDQEKRAMDAVIQYAIYELFFAPEDIVIYGWSIGGFTAAYGAANYPIKALILDATFDDPLPLAKNQMPSSWSRLVKEVIRSYVDLNIGEQVNQYEGPLQLIRRGDDEIICLRSGDITTNRCNNLALKVISHRHPKLAKDEDYMRLFVNCVAMTENERVEAYETDITSNERTVLDVVSLYMRDFASNHCTALPETHFDMIMELLEVAPGVQRELNS